MKCPRCNGLMLVDTFYDCIDHRIIGDRFDGWRCVSCGNVWDLTITANRIHARKFALSHRSRRIDLSAPIAITVAGSARSSSLYNQRHRTLVSDES